MQAALYGMTMVHMGSGPPVPHHRPGGTIGKGAGGTIGKGARGGNDKVISLF